jgi:hypothetical protein
MFSKAAEEHALMLENVLEVWSRQPLIASREMCIFST